MSEWKCAHEGCNRHEKRKGPYCMLHYMRARKGISMDAPYRHDAVARLKAGSVEDSNGCWNWTRSQFEGYGRTKLHGKNVHAHRAMWLATGVEIPEDLQLNHRCNNSLCINPDHLYLGTQLQNMADMYAANRARHLRGSDAPMAKLSEDQVLHIRGMPGPARIAASVYDVSESVVRAIRRREIWKHIE